MRSPISIVVPAWNEEVVLAQLLDSLLRQDGVAIEAAVVANGCSDRTAVLARGYIERFRNLGHALAVIELAAASKPDALNAGDAALKTFPRAYVDADVVLSAGALLAVAAALQEPGIALAAPQIQFTRRPGGLADLVAEVMEHIPPFVDDVVGGGFYAVNGEGRRRWTGFPSVIADDAFVISRFRRAERRVVAGVHFATRFPIDSRLLATFTRWEQGRRQLAEAGIEPERVPRRDILRAVAKAPRWWIGAILVLGLKAAARWRDRRGPAEAARAWARADGG